ncbi:gastrula zinc finger protein XlCGF66.1-like isoform X1 [Bufo gargarizans]|uniref:gastrula zinc finger protein XlCGF66.1-like isoform X1 n=1 Tax=Bufo gargarizans TaxID=30331 RepID=UPI001CF350EB|nr:gastrula zinc finger protein XlCGF66.1-like isoform X1 [Bufo gargarizans]
MDGDGDKMAERILDLTLEILLLLTGEDCSTVKKTSSNLIHEQNNEKILEVVHKMMELLTGEVPIRCQDVAVYFSMEEWEYFEGHKGLYKEVKMEEDQPLTSPERAIQRTTPERCPRPLLPQDGQKTRRAISMWCCHVGLQRNQSLVEFLLLNLWDNPFKEVIQPNYLTDPFRVAGFILT